VTAALGVRNLSEVYGGQAVLATADLIIQPGELRALAGASGSGKSTMVTILAGICERDPGTSLEVAGELGLPRSRLGPAHRRKASSGEWNRP